MWRMLQQPTPEDFVLATGETHPVREFVEKSFKAVGIELKYAIRYIHSTSRPNLLPQIIDGRVVVWTSRPSMSRPERQLSKLILNTSVPQKSSE